MAFRVARFLDWNEYGSNPLIREGISKILLKSQKNLGSAFVIFIISVGKSYGTATALLVSELAKAFRISPYV